MRRTLWSGSPSHPIRGGWFRFPYSSPNTLQASQLETAYHGTHVECLHGLMATGRIMPSNDKVAGMRHFDGRQGVCLHKPSNKHLAQGYAAFIRFGPKHVYLRALCEVEVDPAGSAKRGKKTNQLIFEYDSVRICAFHLQIATKSELKHGDYLREWAGTLEVPLSAALEARLTKEETLFLRQAIYRVELLPTVFRVEILPQHRCHLLQLQQLQR